MRMTFDHKAAKQSKAIQLCLNAIQQCDSPHKMALLLDLLTRLKNGER